MAATVAALLLALILPAVQMSREAARRAKCGSNLRQVALAATNYEATHQVFPAGSALGWSVHAALLPYLDAQPIADAIPSGRPPISFGPAGVVRVDPNTLPGPPAVLVCPADPDNDGSAASYAGSAGTGGGESGDDGLFRVVGEAERGRRRRLGPGNVKDGLTNTVAFAEVPAFVAGNGRGHHNAPPDDDFPPDQLVNDCAALAADPGDGPGAGWGFGRPWAGPLLVYGATLFNHLAPPNATGCVNGTDVPRGTYPAGSTHRGGANAATADGSVRFVTASVDRSVWRAAGTIAGGEVAAQF